MGRFSVICMVGMAAALAACGSTVEESAATGGLGGAAVGAAVGGPAGAAIGLGAGAVAGTGVEKAQDRGMVPQEPGGGSTAQAGSDDVRYAQTVLRDQGLYRGPIDGIEGPLTKQAANEFQRRQGLPQTAALDRRTMDAITGSLAALPPERGPRAPQ